MKNFSLFVIILLLSACAPAATQVILPSPAPSTTPRPTETATSTPTRTPWGSLNARLEGPAGLQLTLFQELEHPPQES